MDTLTTQSHDVALVRFILENAEKFSWSLQGMGMLRLFLNKTLRMHVWDSRFRVPNVSMVHDHLQWALESTIVSGSLINCRYEEHPDGACYMYSTLKPGYGCYFKNDPVAVKLKRRAVEVYPAGSTYSQRPDEIHMSEPQDGTVTLMRKTPTEDGDSARVFWLAGEQWVSTEPREATIEEIRAITQHALYVLDKQEGKVA